MSNNCNSNKKTYADSKFMLWCYCFTYKSNMLIYEAYHRVILFCIKISKCNTNMSNDICLIKILFPINSLHSRKQVLLNQVFLNRKSFFKIAAEGTEG